MSRQTLESTISTFVEGRPLLAAHFEAREGADWAYVVYDNMFCAYEQAEDDSAFGVTAVPLTAIRLVRETQVNGRRELVIEIDAGVTQLSGVSMTEGVTRLGAMAQDGSQEGAHQSRGRTDLQMRRDRFVLSAEATSEEAESLIAVGKALRRLIR